MEFTIIYIHGFASIGNSSKSILLKDSFKGLVVISPTLSPDSIEAIQQMKDILNDVKNPILVGSSLGGFYVDYFNCVYGIPSVLINPLVDSDLIKSFIGENKNLYTGDTFNFTKNSFEYLQTLRKEKEGSKNYLNRKANIIALLSMDDDVLNYITAENEFQSPKQEVRVFATGGHRFTLNDEIILAVRDMINILS